MRQRVVALAALAGAMLLVGSSVAVGRVVALALPVCFASMIRFALATAILIPWVLAREKRWPGVGLRDGCLLGAQAVSGSVLFTVLLFAGLRLSDASEAGVVAATTPAVVALFGWLLFRERLGGGAVLGLLATCAGLSVIESGTAPSGGSHPLLGHLCVFGAVVFEAIFLLLRRALRTPLSPLAAAMWVSLLALICFLPPGLYEATTIDATTLTPTMLCALAYYGVAVTAIAYILWFYGVMRVEASVAGVATGIMPVAALGCAVWLCGETLTWRAVAGCLGVLAGICCLALKKSEAALESRRRGMPPAAKGRAPLETREDWKRLPVHHGGIGPTSGHCTTGSGRKKNGAPTQDAPSDAQKGNLPGTR